MAETDLSTWSEQDLRTQLALNLTIQFLFRLITKALMKPMFTSGANFEECESREMIELMKNLPQNLRRNHNYKKENPGIYIPLMT